MTVESKSHVESTTATSTSTPRQSTPALDEEEVRSLLRQRDMDPISLVKSLNISDSRGRSSEMDWESSRSRSNGIFSGMIGEPVKIPWHQSSLESKPSMPDLKPVNVRLDTNPSILNPKMFAKSAFMHSTPSITRKQENGIFSRQPSKDAESSSPSSHFREPIFIAPSVCHLFINSTSARPDSKICFHRISRSMIRKGVRSSHGFRGSKNLIISTRLLLFDNIVETRSNRDTVDAR